MVRYISFRVYFITVTVLLFIAEKQFGVISREKHHVCVCAAILLQRANSGLHRLTPNYFSALNNQTALP